MYTFPFFYKTKILLTDVPIDEVDASQRLLKVIQAYGLYVEEYNANEFFFTFGTSSFTSKINNGTSGVVKIKKEGENLYASLHIYNKLYSIVTYIVFAGVLIFTHELSIALLFTSLLLILFSVQFYPFVFKFIETYRKLFRND